MVKPYYIKGVYRVKKKHLFAIFYKVVALQSLAKLTGIHVLESLSNKVAGIKRVHRHQEA